ncbi:hypothetical protein LIER_31326 [Lithospermum erythrorhizon]|uniref:Uncharacterized protein n=1 Tax=Lithospermum erythrorhizon TaxID=34254 RepID=A0AAV3RRM4_LITER
MTLSWKEEPTISWGSSEILVIWMSSSMLAFVNFLALERTDFLYLGTSDIGVGRGNCIAAMYPWSARYVATHVGLVLISVYLWQVFVREGDSEDLGRKGKPRPPLNLLSWLSFLLPPCIHGMTRDLNHLNNLPMTSQALVCFPRNHMVF